METIPCEYLLMVDQKPTPLDQIAMNRTIRKRRCSSLIFSAPDQREYLDHVKLISTGPLDIPVFLEDCEINQPEAKLAKYISDQSPKHDIFKTTKKN